MGWGGELPEKRRALPLLKGNQTVLGRKNGTEKGVESQDPIAAQLFN